MFREFGCVQPMPSRSRCSQKIPRMSSEAFEKQYL
jgi:hypothetical protein